MANINIFRVDKDKVSELNSSLSIYNCIDINQFCYYCCVKEMNIIGDESIKECNDNCNNL